MSGLNGVCEDPFMKALLHKKQKKSDWGSLVRPRPGNDTLCDDKTPPMNMNAL